MLLHLRWCWLNCFCAKLILWNLLRYINPPPPTPPFSFWTVICSLFWRISNWWGNKLWCTWREEGIVVSGGSREWETPTCFTVTMPLWNPVFFLRWNRWAEYIHFGFEQPEHADGTRNCRHLPDETLGGTETAPELFNTAEILLSALVSMLQLPQ